jgi:hypothetical protein
MRYHKKTVISSRVDSRWLAALDRKEGAAPALAHEWADQGEVGLFVNPDTRGQQLPLPAPTVPDGRDAARWQANLLAILSAFIAGIATGKLL